MNHSDAISRVLGLLRQTDMTGDRKVLAEAIVTAIHLADQLPWKAAVGDAVIVTLTGDSHFFENHPSAPMALWVERAGDGLARSVIAFQDDLDRVHPILWPTLLAQYDLGADEITFAVATTGSDAR